MSLGTVGELAQRVSGRAIGDASVTIEAVAAIDEAGANALTFATTPTYFQSALRSRAAAVLVDESVAGSSPAGDFPKPLIVVANARAALMHLLRAFDRPRKRGPLRHPSAIVHESAAIGEGSYIGPNAIVGARTRIGARGVIDAGAYVGEDVVVGDDVTIHPQARIMDGCVLGDRVILHPGATIGADGFGYVFLDGRFERIPQIGNVVLGDDVEIGANTCIDRAQTGSTSIGDGSKIDNLCQIGHNCRIGRHTAIAGLTGLAGSTNIGDYVLVGGQVGFKGHITVGSRVKIAARSEIWGDLPDDAFVTGAPARPHQEALRREVMVRNLPKLMARVDALEKKYR